MQLEVAVHCPVAVPSPAPFARHLLPVICSHSPAIGESAR